MIATYLLTGGRRNEVFGLLLSDIDFENKLVRIQPNEHRRLKRVWSERAVPLWPQLGEILRPYVDGLSRSGDDLLFPGQTGAMITDLRKSLGTIAAEAGIEMPRLTKFRHTYTTARIQTTDGGKQISLWDGGEGDGAQERGAYRRHDGVPLTVEGGGSGESPC